MSGLNCLQASFQDAQTWIIDCVLGFILGRIEVKHDYGINGTIFSTCSHPGHRERNEVSGKNTRIAQVADRDVVI